MKIWTRGSSPWSGTRNIWTRIKNFNGASRLSKFWIFFGTIQMISCRAWLVTVVETRLYHYDPETKQQSKEWWHSGSILPPPKKKSECKNPLEKFSPRFFGIKTASFSLYTGCPRRNGQNFGRVFLMLKYTDITQNTYIQSWMVREIMAREVWKYDSCYTLIDYQIHIKTGGNMWFL